MRGGVGARVGKTLGDSMWVFDLDPSPELPFPWLLALVRPPPTPNRSEDQLEASRTSSFYFHPKITFPDVSSAK